MLYHEFLYYNGYILNYTPDSDTPTFFLILDI